jgi:hypothetical protein
MHNTGPILHRPTTCGAKVEVGPIDGVFLHVVEVFMIAPEALANAINRIASL